MGICEGNQINKTTEESKTKVKSDKGEQIQLENPNEVRFLPLADLKEYRKAQKRNEKPEL